MGQLDDNKATYRRFIDILNSQQVDALPEVVDTGAYREICVGATPGWVDYEAAVASVQQIFASMGDINVSIDDCAAEDDKVFARNTVTATNTGPMMGMPATNKAMQAYMFDYVKLRDNRIVERIQLSDNMGMMQQLFGGMPGMPGAGS
jgi:predicted ester cyclase